jgi:RNA polymerase sigma-70 factor (ECF subfamily)
MRAMKPAPTEAQAPHAAPSSLNEQPVEASVAPSEADRRHVDVELVKRLQAGDQAAFRELYERYHRRAFGVAMGVVKNQADALDVVQEAFIKVHKHIGTFQGSSSFYTWLYRIVMNLGIDQIRRRRKVVEFDDGVRRDDATGDRSMLPKIALENPSKMVVREELSEKIRAALDTLPEYHRAVIILREVEGMSYEEMAQVMRVPKGTIMSRLFHARRKMQEQLGSYLEGDLEVTE